MPAFAQSSGGFLTDAQIEILAGGICSRWSRSEAVVGAKLPPYAATSPGDPRRGEAVYSKFCALLPRSRRQGNRDRGVHFGRLVSALVSDQGLLHHRYRRPPGPGAPGLAPMCAGRSNVLPTGGDVVAWLIAQRPATPDNPIPGNPDSNRTQEEPMPAPSPHLPPRRPPHPCGKSPAANGSCPSASPSMRWPEP